MITDQTVRRYVDELGVRLVGGLPPELPHAGFYFSFEVVNRNDLATVALPGGTIFVTRGMIAPRGPRLNSQDCLHMN